MIDILQTDKVIVSDDFSTLVAGMISASSIILNIAGCRQRLISLPDVAYSQFPSELKWNKILHNPPSC